MVCVEHFANEYVGRFNWYRARRHSLHGESVENHLQVPAPEIGRGGFGHAIERRDHRLDNDEVLFDDPNYPDE